MNFAKKQSDNLEQQETSPSCTLQSPLERVLSLLRPRAAPTELRALVVEEQEDLETDDEGLISFEEERVRSCPQRRVPDPSCVPAVGHRGSARPGDGPERLSEGVGWVPAPAARGVWAARAAPEPCPPCARRLSSRSTRTRCAEGPGRPQPRL